MANNRLSYPKALAKLGVMPQGKGTKRWIYAQCLMCYAHDCSGGSRTYVKLQGYREFIARGWTYDEAGRWICPGCKEGV